MLVRPCNIFQWTSLHPRWSRGHKAQGQGQGHKKNPRPRPSKAFPRTDPLEAKDRNARGQGQGTRTQAQVLSKKKRSSQKFFKRSSQNNVFQKIFQALHKILTIQKILLSSSRGQANFRGLEASRPRPRTSKLLKLPRGLHLCPTQQRWKTFWSPWPYPRGHILSLALASRPQVLENWPVLGSRTAVFFELLKFCGALEKFFRKRFFVEIAWKIFVKTFFFFLESTCACVLGLGLEHSCPWPRECLSSESLSLASDFFVSLALASSLVSSTPLCCTILNTNRWEVGPTITVPFLKKFWKRAF